MSNLTPFPPPSRDLYDTLETWVKQNPSFCTQPFVKAMNIDEMHQPCCEIRDDVINKPKFSRVSWFDKEYVKLRNDMINGHKNPACADCYKLEDNGFDSKRIRVGVQDLHRWHGFFDDLLGNEYDDSKTHAKSLTIKFSNFCNLACRMCYPYASSLIAKLENAESGEHHERAKTDKSLISENWESIKEASVKCDQIIITGGEPLLMPGTEALIDFLVENNPSALLTFTTNCTSYKPKVFEQLNKLDFVEIAFSIDSVGDNLEYIRWPSKHEKTVGNIKEFIKYENINFTVVPIFYINNVFYIREILDFWAQFIEETNYTKLQIMPSLISDREYFKLDILPNIYKSFLAGHLGNITEHRLFDMLPGRPDSDGNTTPGESTLINFKNLIRDISLFTQNTTENLPAFLKYLDETARWDVLTNTTMELGNKKLFDCLSNEHKEIYFSAQKKYQSLKISN